LLQVVAVLQVGMAVVAVLADLELILISFQLLQQIML
jgi:hypothetical protein